jgi:hypothetical protein
VPEPVSVVPGRCGEPAERAVDSVVESVSVIVIVVVGERVVAPEERAVGFVWGWGVGFGFGGTGGLLLGGETAFYGCWYVGGGESGLVGGCGCSPGGCIVLVAGLDEPDGEGVV